MVDYPQEKEKIRVSLMVEEASGPFLRLSFDQEKPQDESFDVQGLTFIVDKHLLKQCGAINIDYIEDGNSSGFKITTANPLVSQDENLGFVPCELLNLCH